MFNYNIFRTQRPSKNKIILKYFGKKVINNEEQIPVASCSLHDPHCQRLFLNNCALREHLINLGLLTEDLRVVASTQEQRQRIRAHELLERKEQLIKVTCWRKDTLFLRRVFYNKCIHVFDFNLRNWRKESRKESQACQECLTCHIASRWAWRKKKRGLKESVK